MTNIIQKDYKSNHLRGYLPMNFNIDKHTEENPPDKVTDFNRDTLVYLLSLVVRIPARAESHDSEYANIKAEYLYNRIPNYREYLNYAIETGILETDNQYRPGKKSRGYKFSDKFFSRVRGETIVKYSLVRAENRERQKKNEETTAKYSYLTSHFNQDLHIDYDEAKRLLISSSETDNQYNHNLVRLDQIKDREWIYTVDNTAFRFHSNLTNLKSEFRQYLTYGNEYLVSTDISNSQPFFSLVLFDPGFYEESTNAFNFHSFLSNIYSINTSSSSHPFSSLSSLMIGVVNNEDVTSYKELVLSGRLYEYFARELDDEFGMVYSDRGDLKEDFFHGFYAPNRVKWNSNAGYLKLRRLFKERFPTSHKVFSLLKRKDYRFFPVLLQRIESFIIIEQICSKIAQLRPHLPIYTVHDSIVTTRGNEDFVTATMNEEIERVTGYTPTLKKELWKKED